MSSSANTKVAYWEAFKPALKATVITYAVADLAFACTIPQFTMWRTGRTEFAFQLMFLTSPFAWSIALLAGAAAVQSRRFFLPTFLGAILLLVFMPGYGWSGPGDLFNAIFPLITLKLELRFLAFFAEMAFLYAWVAPWKDRVKASLPLPTSPLRALE